MSRPKRTPRVASGTFAALVRLYLSPANAKWANPPPVGWSAGTRKVYANELAFMTRDDMLGGLTLDEIRPSDVQGYFDGIATRPGKQEMDLAILQGLEKWAIVREFLPRQITLGVEIGHSKGGHIPWTEEQVALAEQHAPPKLARAVTLVANTGQRGSDLIRMAWTDIEEYRGIRGINVRQQKTGRQLWIPITSELATAMAGWERTAGPFLTRPDGSPWTRGHLTKAWQIERDTNPALEPLRFGTEPPRLVLPPDVDPGLDTGLVLHGGRGTACVRLRRSSATESEISAMVGMSIAMVARYCRFSVQRENAATAAAKLDRTFAERLAAKWEK